MTGRRVLVARVAGQKPGGFSLPRRPGCARVIVVPAGRPLTDGFKQLGHKRDPQEQCSLTGASHSFRVGPSTVFTSSVVLMVLK